MIITCNNCNKKFDIDSNLIPDKGRLLQCASCDHKWFFKKEALENTASPIDEDISIDSVNILDQNNSSINEEKSVTDEVNDEVEVDLEEETKKKIEISIDESPQENNKPKKQTFIFLQKIPCSQAWVNQTNGLSKLKLKMLVLTL